MVQAEATQSTQAFDAATKSPVLPTVTKATSLHSSIPLEDADIASEAGGLDKFQALMEEAAKQRLPSVGLISDAAQTFRLQNDMGRKLKVVDEEGNVIVQAAGHFKVLGYNFDFSDAEGNPLFTVETKEFKDQEHYEWRGADGAVLGTARRDRLQVRTAFPLYAGAFDKASAVPVAQCRSTKAGLGGEFQVTDPSGVALGSVKRLHKKGVVTRQQYAITVQPGADPFLMIVMAAMCNCMTNERSRLFWGAMALAAFC